MVKAVEDNFPRYINEKRIWAPAQVLPLNLLKKCDVDQKDCTEARDENLFCSKHTHLGHLALKVYALLGLTHIYRRAQVICIVYNFCKKIVN